MKKRDIQLDIVRGLAIFSVVLGHLDTGLKGQIIYLFHMPFFFIISGYFHKSDPMERRYFKRKSLSLLLPYFIYLFLLKSPDIRTRFVEVLASPDASSFLDMLTYMAKLVYGGDWLTGYTGVSWFVTCLFLTQQLYNFLSLRISRKSTLLWVAAGFYGIALIDDAIPGHVSFPWNLNVVCCAIMFYIVGAVYGKTIFKSRNWWLLGLCGAVTLACSSLLALGYPIQFNMKLASYGYVFLSPLAAVCMSKLASEVSYWLAKVRGLAPLLAAMGTAAITIMFFHRTVQYTIPEIFYAGPSWMTAIAVTAICMIFHWLLKQISLTRALFLGSRRDAAALVGQFSRTSA